MDKDPKTRLSDPEKIKKHAWFDGMKWEEVLNKKL